MKSSIEITESTHLDYEKQYESVDSYKSSSINTQDQTNPNKLPKTAVKDQTNQQSNDYHSEKSHSNVTDFDIDGMMKFSKFMKKDEKSQTKTFTRTTEEIYQSYSSHETQLTSLTQSPTTYIPGYFLNNCLAVIHP